MGVVLAASVLLSSSVVVTAAADEPEVDTVVVEESFDPETAGGDELEPVTEVTDPADGPALPEPLGDEAPLPDEVQPEGEGEAPSPVENGETVPTEVPEAPGDAPTAEPEREGPRGDVGEADGNVVQGEPDDLPIEPFAVSDVAILIGYDGTATFDTGPQAPGNDTGPANGIVRTNDVVQYAFQYNSATPLVDPFITSTLPEGMAWDSSDPKCVGTGTTPLPSGIYDSVTMTPGGDRRLLVCQLPSSPSSISDEIRPLARVQVLPNGTTLPVDFTADDASNSPVTSDPISVEVSAAPFYDLRKFSRGGSRPAVGPDGTTPGVADSFNFAITLAHPTRNGRVDGVRGMAPLEDPITFVDDLSGYSPNAALYNWGDFGQGCHPVPAGSGTLPASAIGGSPGATATNSVRNTGTITCTPGPGQSFDITLTGMDTSGLTFPTQGAGGTAIPPNFLYVATGTVWIWHPLSDLANGEDGLPGTPDDNRLVIDNAMTGFDPDDTTGQSNYGAGTESLTTCFGRGTDACHNAVTFIKIAGIGPGKSYRDFDTGLVPDGASGIRSGDLRAGLGYTVRGDVGVSVTGIPAQNVTVCDVFDRSSQRLISGPSGAPAIMAQTAFGTVQPGQYVLEYGAASSYPTTFADARASLCTDVDATWSTDPTAASLGGALTPNGYRDSIDRVRVRFLVPLGSEADYHVHAFLEFYAPSTMDPALNPDGTIIANFGQVLSGATPTWSENTFDPIAFTGGLGDRARLVPGEVRIDKALVESAPGSGSQVLAGQFARFRLAPTATQLGSVPGGPLANVVVTDILPTTQPRLRLDPLSVTVPPGVGVEYCTSCDGTDWSLVAPSSAFGVRWNFGDVQPGTVLPQLFYNAIVPIEALNGQTYTNTTTISSPSDPSTEALRSSDASATVAAPSTVLATKATAEPILPLDTNLTWALTVRNATATDVARLDVIDLLPYPGDPRTPASTFAGGYSAVAVANVPAGLIAYVTADDPAVLDAADGTPDGLVDPGRASDPWFVAPGTGAWSCTIDAIGTAGCPSASDVTGVRFASPVGGSFALPSQASLTWSLTLTPTGNAAGDLYTNQFMGRVDEAVLQLPVTSPPVPIQVVAPSVAIVKDVCTSTVCAVDDEDVWAQSHRLPTGDDAIFRLTVTNDGIEPGDITVADALPAGLEFVPGSAVASIGDASAFPDTWSVGSLNPGESATITFRTASTSSGTQVNTADAVIEDRFGQQADDVDDAVVDVVDPVVTIAKDLTGIDIGADGTGLVSYAVTVSNASGFPTVYDLTDELRFAPGIVIESATVTNTEPGDLPLNPTWDGTSDLAVATGIAIAAGEAHRYEISVRVRVPFQLDDDTQNCSEFGEPSGLLNVASGTGGGLTSTDDACEPAPTGRITLEKTGPATASPGGTLTWNIAVTNTGALDATDFTVTDMFPADVTFVSATGNPELHDDGTLEWHLTTLAVGETVGFTVVATLPEGFVGDVTNCATFTDPGPTTEATIATTEAQVVDGAIDDTGDATCVITEVSPDSPDGQDAPWLAITGAAGAATAVLAVILIALGLISITSARRRRSNQPE